MSIKKVVSVSNLSKSFETSKGSVKALRRVDFDLFAGEIFGFLGPNGAGKTTTLRILTTLLPYDEGEVLVAGFDVKKRPHDVRKKIGYVSQKGGADRKATGWENLLLQGRLYGMSRIEVEKEAKELVSTFALEECIERFVSTYSGGQQRRLDIALGMIHRPEILFLDEPTNGLDPQNRSHLWSKIQTLKERGVTIFLTSHYMDEVDALSERLAIMDDGRIVASGSPALLKSEISGDIVTIGIRKRDHSKVMKMLRLESIVREITPHEELLRLSVDKGEAALPHIFRLLEQAKVKLETVHMAVPSLNDVFLKQTGRLLRNEGME